MASILVSYYVLSQGFGSAPHSTFHQSQKSSSSNRHPPRLFLNMYDPDHYPLTPWDNSVGHCCSMASDPHPFSKLDSGSPFGSRLSAPTNSASALGPTSLSGADRGLEGTSFINRPSASTSKPNGPNRLFLASPSFRRPNPPVVSEPHLVTLDKSTLDSTSSSSKLLSTLMSPPTDLPQSSPPRSVISPSLGSSDLNRVVSFGRPSPDSEAPVHTSPSNSNIELHPVSMPVVSPQP